MQSYDGERLLRCFTFKTAIDGFVSVQLVALSVIRHRTIFIIFTHILETIITLFLSLYDDE